MRDIKTLSDKELLRLRKLYRGSIVESSTKWGIKYRDVSSIEKHLNDYEIILKEIFRRKLV